MKTLITVLIFILVFDTMVFAAAKVPSTPAVKIWEPFYWQINDEPSMYLIQELDRENTDWVACRYKDNNPEDDDLEDCERGMADILGVSGVLAILTHGSSAHIELALAGDRETLLEWVGDEGANSLWATVNPITQGGKTYHKVEALPKYCEDYWSADANYYDSIVFLGACSAFPGFKNKLGGVTRFGYEIVVNFSEYVDDIQQIFRYMNGYNNSGNYRIASEAYNYYDENSDTYLKMSGGNSTLAPAPVKTDPVLPQNESNAGASGSGYIKFDTIMDTSVDANSALTWTCTEGTAIVTNIVWDTENKNKITFDYCGSPGYTLQMTAVAEYCRIQISSPYDYVKLNGDRVDGNEDDYSWSFSY